MSNSIIDIPEGGQLRYSIVVIPIYTAMNYGAWLSLVERSVRGREVGGSNPLAPTNIFNQLRLPKQEAFFINDTFNDTFETIKK